MLIHHFVSLVSYLVISFNEKVEPHHIRPLSTSYHHHHRLLLVWEMAYAAVMSIMHTIKGLVDSSHIPIDSSTREILLSAFDHALSLQRTLQVCSEGVGDMDEQIFIIEAAHKLEDAIEFPLLSQPPTFFSNLHHHVDFFVRTATERKEIIEGLWEQKAAEIIEEDVKELFGQKPSNPDQEEEEEDIEMVGLCDQFLQIRDYLLADKRDTIWISGMAGIGKTRLAKRILDDPLVKTNFQRLAFVRVGKKCRSILTILQAIIDQVSHDDGGMSIQVDGDLLQSFHKIFSVKSLIVLDDVWYWYENLIHELHPEAWRNGIQILVTSRYDTIFPSYWGLKIRFMDAAESWELLRKKVFGKEEECPSQLVKPGKKIAEKCEGLPLLINNVASILLSTTQKDTESWNRVAEKPDSILEEASYQISEVLLSSYHEIDDIKQLCFLFMAAFPRSSIVSCSRTINLWRVEGIRSFFPENDFAFEYIMVVLILRNLVVEHQQRWNGTYRAYSLHCAYWYLSRRIAQNNKFLYILKSSSDDLDESLKSHRRLAIQENVLLAIKEVHDKIASISTVRSLLCTGPYHQYQVPICWEWKLLRVLHVLTVRFYEFPIEVVKLIRLRYLSLTCNANLPPSISKLCNLEFLIVHQHLSIKRVAVVSYVPVEIWDLQQLKHLEIIGKNLPDPRPGAVLPNLTKLYVGVESCTKGVLQSIPQLEKLRIQIELGPDDAQTLSLFDHISSLEKLKSFQIIILNSTLLRPPPPLSMFKSSLRKLSLSGFGYSWEDMTKIVELTQLEELKLKCYAFRGEKWEAKGMVFERLGYLLIEDTDLREWTAEYESFPWLQRLTMKNCYKLQEIPLFSSKYEHCIELVDCNPLAETCAKQRYSTEERVIVTASYSWKGKKLKP